MNPIFSRSPIKGKKYKVVFTIGSKQYTRHFGALGYEHYRDSTGLGLYSHLDHNDEDRRKKFRSRFNRLKGDPMSSGYWAYWYLW